MRCEVCLKTQMSGNNVSHSKRRTKTKFQPNTHRQTLVLNGRSVKAKLCTRCLRSAHKSPKIFKALGLR
ncbi:MAG: 50S ribosomal protein L28 [Dehalococcoidia bacterium]|nr:50S ribosomal protein L28 [Dehalococcoidia bacterium]MSQ16848.1 50S ribosomal protein L28 [Dehalococcoidia bacterium]